MAHRPSTLFTSTNIASHSSSSSTSQSALQSRVNQKTAELQNLRQLRDLSSQLATQMGTLEDKLATLRDGTEAVSEVLKNWSNVLGVLQMVGGQVAGFAGGEGVLPGTLVRIPVEREGSRDGVGEDGGAEERDER